jgi:xanthine dehydrogenase accessory factor
MIWRRILSLVERQGRAALISVIDVEGSAPREAGARMVLAPNAVISGTIGGGRLEYQAISLAEAALSVGMSAAEIRTWPLGPNLGQCCGGAVTVLIETFDGSDLDAIQTLAEAERAGPFVTVSRMTEQGRIARDITDHSVNLAPARKAGGRQPFAERFGEASTPLLLFGAGHVGRALVLALAQLPFAVRWIDSRAGQFPSHAPANVVALHIDRPEREIEAAPAGGFVLIMTHSHPLDYAIAAAALHRPELCFIGLIGSATKRARFTGQALRLGLGAEAMARLVCPIGLPGITAKEPHIIAAGVAAQLLIERERCTGSSPRSA